MPLESFSLKNFTFRSALFIYDDASKKINFKRASSNIPKISIICQKGINVKDLITYDKVFIEKQSIEEISKRLS